MNALLALWNSTLNTKKHVWHKWTSQIVEIVSKYASEKAMVREIYVITLFSKIPLLLLWQGFQDSKVVRVRRVQLSHFYDNAYEIYVASATYGLNDSDF